MLWNSGVHLKFEQILRLTFPDKQTESQVVRGKISNENKERNNLK